MNKKDLMRIAKEGPVKIDTFCEYVVVKVNEENIKLTDKFKSQLIEENKYDETYIGFITSEKNKPYAMSNLPIYGRTDKYETKHINRDINKVISKDIKDYKLLERIS